MKTKVLLPLLLALALPAAGATYRAGLWQSKWSARYDWTGADPATDVERTPGVVMADVQATDANYASVGYSNAWSGAVTRWNQSNTMFAYTGQMWMEGGVKYTFGKILDDGVRIVVDGAQVMQHQTWKEWTTDSCTPAFTGWHDIEIRLCDEDGGKGPSNQNAWGNDRGLGWNATGVASANLTDWNWFREDGVTTRFRCADTNDAIAAGTFERTATGFDFAVSNRSDAAVAVALYRSSSDDYASSASWTPVAGPVELAAGGTATISVATSDETPAAYQIGASGSDPGTFDWFYQFVPFGALGSMQVAGVGGKTIDCTAVVSDLGGAESARVRVEASTTPGFAEIVSTSDEATVTTAGATQPFTLYGFSYESTYYLRLRMETGAGAAYAPYPFPVTTAPAPFPPTKVFAGGLVQAQIDGAQANRTTAIADVADANKAFVPGTIMANTTGNGTDSAGKTWSWTGNRVFAYGGKMWMEGGTTYTFGKMVDDWTYVVIDGSVLLDNDTWNGFASCDYAPAASGWVPVEFRFGNGGGGAGVSQDAKWGFAFNTEGNTTWDPDYKSGAAPWKAAIDPGDASLFFTEYSDTPIMTVDSLVPAGGDLVVTASFAGVPAGGGVVQVLYGPGDGDFDTNNWANAVVAGTVAEGDSADATFSVEGAGGAAFAAVRLVAGDGASAAWFQWSPIYSLAAESPSFGLVNTVRGYTNLTYTATCTGMGLGATSVSAELVIARDAEFQNLVTNVALSLSGIGGETVELAGFTTNTTYYARVVGENSEGKTGASSPVIVTTLDPLPPAGRASFDSRGFSSLSFVGVVSDWGAGSSSALLTLDVSTDPAFPAETTLSFPGAEALAGAVPASQPLTATGLAGATAYWARVRIRNEWGLETAVPLAVSYDTLSTPFEMSSPGATPGGEGVQTLSISCLSVEEGTTYGVTLSVDGKPVKTWSGLSEPGDFTVDWTGKPGSSHSAVFAVSSSTAGTGFSAEYPFSFSVGGAIRVVSSLDELATTILRVGDQLVLPALATGESLVYDTNAVVSVVGTTFTALEPGASRIRRYAADPVTGEAVLAEDGVLIVAPRDEDVKGGLFVRRTGTGDFTWRNKDSWEKISGKGDWPDGPDDIALVYLPLTQDMSVQLGNADVTLGHLGAGSTLNGNTIFFRSGGFTFRTTDGSESWLRFSGRNGGNGPLSFEVPVTLVNDLVMDGMGQNYMSCKFGGTLTIGDHTLRTARVPYYGGGKPTGTGQIRFFGKLVGSGTILHEADATTSLIDIWGGAAWPTDFVGTWDIRNGRHDGEYGGAGLFLGKTHLYASKELAVRGAWMADTAARRGANVRTGWSNGYQYSTPTNYFDKVFPPKVTLDGGRLQIHTEGPLDAKYQDELRENWYVMDEFRLATGPMGSLWCGIYTWHDGCYPNSHTVVTNLVVEPGATASFSLDTSANRKYGVISNDFHVVNAPAAAWDSGKGYEILPFFYPNCENDNFRVAIRDTATGRVTLAGSVHSEGATGTIRLFQLNNGSQDHTETMPSGADYQSVIVDSNRKTAFAEENGVVRISSGLLGLRGGSQFGRLATATTASSTLDFGSRPGYVYVGRQNETADIGCRVAGTAGFVKSAGGTLRLYRPMDALTGGVWVGAGRLSLLEDATLGDNDVFVAAGAKLRITRGDAFGTGSRLDLEDRDWISTASRIELENAEMARVRRLYVNGENLHRGYYGSSEAEASLAALASVGFPAFVDDRLFSGPGVLKVKSDDLLQPTLMILR